MASEDFATEGQIKRLYAVLHSIGRDPKEGKKDKNIASYAKLTRGQCSAFIDDVEAIEAEQKNKLHAERREVELNVQNREETDPFGDRAEAQRIREEQGREADAAPAQPAQPTVADLIAKYTGLLAQVTEAVAKEDRIPDREKGYAVKFIFYSVRGALENGGGRIR